MLFHGTSASSDVVSNMKITGLNPFLSTVTYEVTFPKCRRNPLSPLRRHSLLDGAVLSYVTPSVTKRVQYGTMLSWVTSGVTKRIQCIFRVDILCLFMFMIVNSEKFIAKTSD